MNKKKLYSFRYYFKKALNILSWATIIFLIVIGALLIYYVYNAKNHEKAGKEYKPPFALYTIISPSMEPNIKVYDVVLTKKVNDPNDIKVGDVITFVSTANISTDLTVTHRVSRIDDVNGEKRYITRGDNNIKDDESYTLFGNVMGKVMIKIPQLGRVQFLLASKGGWFIIVMLPAMGIIIYDLLKIFKLFDLKDEVITLSQKEEDDEEEKKKMEEEQRRKEELKRRIINKDNNQQDNSMPIFEDTNNNKNEEVSVKSFRGE